MASLPTTDIDIIDVRNSIGETITDVGGLRSSAKNNWWGFKYPYVSNIQWGKAPLVASDYDLGDYRAYEHTYLAVRFMGVEIQNTPEWFEDSLQIKIETAKILGLMINPTISYMHEYKVYGSANVSHDGWTLLTTQAVVNDADVIATINFDDVPNLSAEDTLYYRIEHYDSVGRRFDDSVGQSMWNNGNGYEGTYITPAAIPAASVKIVSASVYAYWDSGDPKLYIDTTVVREYGSDPDASYSAQHSIIGQNTAGTSFINNSSNSVSVVGRDVNKLIATTLNLDYHYYTVGASGYVDLKMTSPIGNINLGTVRVSFTVSDIPPQ